MDARSCSLKDAKKIEDEIIHECRKRGGQKWSDPNFPCSSKSLFVRDSSLDVDEWKRLTEMGHNTSVFVDGVSSGTALLLAF